MIPKTSMIWVETARGAIKTQRVLQQRSKKDPKENNYDDIDDDDDDDLPFTPSRIVIVMPSIGTH